MKRWTFALLAAFAVLGLQGCDREPPRTVVHPPGPSSPDNASLNAPVPQAPPQPVAAASAPVVSEAPAEPAPPTPPATEAMGAQPAASAAPAAPSVDGTAASDLAAPTELSPSAGAASTPAAKKPAERTSARDVGDAEGARLLAQHALLLPVTGVQPTALSDNFAQGRGKRKHEAIDILAPAGTPVVAVEDGRVAKLFTSKPGGLTVYQFDRESRLAYYYAHLKGYAPGLREGMDVKRGDLIGYVGSTGNADPGTPHLHFAIFRLGTPPRWWEGEAVNPYPALKDAQASQVAAR